MRLGARASWDLAFASASARDPLTAVVSVTGEDAGGASATDADAAGASVRVNEPPPRRRGAPAPPTQRERPRAARNAASSTPSTRSTF